MVFEHEKERAKWNLEKDHIMNMKNDLQEALEASEKKKEALLRETEKVRNDKRNSRQSSYFGFG